MNSSLALVPNIVRLDVGRTCPCCRCSIELNSIESRGSVVGIMTRLRHGCPRNYGSVPGRVKGFISSPKYPDRFYYPPCNLFSAPSPRTEEMTIHFYRVPKARMDGAITLLTRTPSWRVQRNLIPGPCLSHHFYPILTFKNRASYI
jgi:hypothetical protein